MKSDYLVVVADGARARFFTLDQAAQPAVESGPHLQELEDMANTEHELGGGDKYSSTRTGINLNPHGGPSHGYDDHRAKHEQEHERRFAHDITSRAVVLAKQYHISNLVLTAEKHMLGLLRDELKIPAQSGIRVSELAKDLTKLKPTEVHDHLGHAGVVPSRQGIPPG